MEREFIDIPIQEIPVATKEEVKFMQLLNEYLLKYYAEHGDKNLHIELGGWSLFNVHEVVIVSRRFGFIKWLVKNNKIDLQQLEEKLLKIWIYKNIWYYEWLLMLLSIQDNPIEFLISILK